MTALALAKVLCGKVNPSGKLPVTIAEKYEDYPSAGHFSWEKGHMEQILDYDSYGLSAEENGSVGFRKSPVTVYWEDIYNGYRYFDTFGKEVLFPFGHGLSYTSFQIKDIELEKTKDGAEVTAVVRNTGNVPGKEVVQLYLSGDFKECPNQELKGFEKTKLLGTGDEEQVRIKVPWKAFAVYDEGQAAWKIMQGTYALYLGVSSRDTECAGQIHVGQEILVEQCCSRLPILSCNQGKIRFLSSSGQKRQGRMDSKRIAVTVDDVCIEAGNGEGNPVVRCNSEAESLKGLSVEELAALCVGYGPGTPFFAIGDTSDPPTIYDEKGEPVTTNSHPTGFPGYVSPAIEDKKIFSVFYKDGPAGIGETVWPTAMLIACGFQKSLWYEFGNAVGRECEKQGVDVWLAPAVNLHRNPLCGRNFEYFSEDPYLTGICACEIARGVQENRPVLVCPKHFAVNEQETYRRGSRKDGADAVDSIVSERALRELYLKPFEMLVKDVGISCIMMSFNKINGVLAGGNADLCKHILREEPEVMEEYSYEGNPLFIPEVRKDAATASYCLYAFMKYHAICYSPFGIEDLGVPPEEMDMPSQEVMTALNINPLVFDTDGGKIYLSKIYELLYHLQPLYLRYRGTERMQSYVRKSDMESGICLRFRKYNVLIEYMPFVKGKPLAAGVIFELEKDKFLIAGMMSKIFFHAKPAENVKVSVLTLQEGRILDGEWEAKRTLNGDEQMMMVLGDLPSCLYIELFQY